MDRKHDTTRSPRRRGAAMMELVMVLPLILVILALLFYLGRMEVRVQRTQTMVRYEAWRAAEDGTGPHSSIPHGHAQLNQTFFARNASRIEQRWPSDETDEFEGLFPLDPARRMAEAGTEHSYAAGEIAERYVWQPNAVGSRQRQSAGVNRAFAVNHADAGTDWARIGRVWQRPDGVESTENPGSTAILRRHYRVGTDWQYTNDWRASADRWQDVGGVGELHHLRAIRDAFFEDFDSRMDGLDGGTDPEYPSDETEGPGPNLAGHIRRLYLQPVGYRGPRVANSVSGDEDPLD